MFSSHVSICVSHASICMSHVSICMSHVSICMSHASVLITYIHANQKFRTLGIHMLGNIINSGNTYVICIHEYTNIEHS